MNLLSVLEILLTTKLCFGQYGVNSINKLHRVFAWGQLTYDINGQYLTQDRESGDVLEQSQSNVSPRRTINNGWSSNGIIPSWPDSNNLIEDDPSQFFTQYNNVPMGAERVGDRLFITVPRRRYGIPSTLNYINLSENSNTISPPLKPYPNLRESRSLTSVYRTRADECGRLWMVDTGLLEIPKNRQQVQRPAIVIFDLYTNKQLLRYPLKDSDLPTTSTPSGLPSITVDVSGDCTDAYAYIPDLVTYGLIVYSLKNNDSWRFSNNYFYFDPTMGRFNFNSLQYQWNDGLFSVTLGPGSRRCKTAYFHPMVSSREFSVSTCFLKNKTMIDASDPWNHYGIVGDRGLHTESTMHAFHGGTNVVLYADVGRNAISCWHAGTALTPSNTAILVQDNALLNYPSDLHVTEDEVWIMANSLPHFAYSRLDANKYNFFVYKANIRELISGSICAGFNYGF